MAQASRDAGVRADYFEHSAASLEKQLAEGLTAYTAPEVVQRLRTSH
ncbi:hypothetical protein [Streptomyces silaceus]|nr:hypothetical protein [Streptomyces silaceus]